jgi:hypothetical protein
MQFVERDDGRFFSLDRDFDGGDRFPLHDVVFGTATLFVMNDPDDNDDL